MKYFTPQLCRGDLSDAEFQAAFDEYRHYIESIRSQLPKAARILNESVSLHDARLSELSADFAAGQLSIVFDGFDIHKDAPANTIQISLRYLKTERIAFAAGPGHPLPNPMLAAPETYRELLYDEFELPADGLLEHRMLFSTGMVLVVRFRDLHLAVEPDSHSRSQ